MPYEITVTEIRIMADTSNGKAFDDRRERLKMTIDGELDIPTVIKAITIPKRKRNAKKAAA